MKQVISKCIFEARLASIKLASTVQSRAVQIANCALFVVGTLVLSVGVQQTSYADVDFDIGGGVCTDDFCIGGGIGSGGHGGGFRQGGGGFYSPGVGVEQGDFRIHEINWRLFELIEGNLGALIMITAGIAAIISAAFGAYRAAIGLLVVAVGAFILRSLVDIFFDFF